MNFRFVISQLGLLLLVLAGVLGVVALWEIVAYALGDRDEFETVVSMVATLGIGLAVGGAMWAWGRRGLSRAFGRRDAILLVSASWILGGLFGAVPFRLWAAIHATPDADPAFDSWVNCIFESFSGLTTSGASILSDIESLPDGLLLWRAMEHWVGGVGIVLVFVALLPMLGISAKKMFHVEAPGPVPSGLRPRIRETAVVLIWVYAGLTAVQMIILRGCGMSWFDAFCHTAATVATGGFSPRNASVGAYASSAVNWTIVVFMLLSSVNFGLYYQLTRGQWRQVLADSELRVFGVLVFASAAVIIGIQLIMPQPILATTGQTLEPTAGQIVEQGAFMAASIQTTTGFGTCDYNNWPYLAHAALVAATFIGGCAGSTTGGIKVIRFWIVLKVIYAKLEEAFRPHVVRSVRTSAGVVSPELRLDVLVYAFGTIALLMIAASALMVFEAGASDFTTAFTACLANFCTTGPGLGKVGPIANYGWMTDASKLTLCGVMMLGRLEIFPLLVLAAPAFWRNPS